MIKKSYSLIVALLSIILVNSFAYATDYTDTNFALGFPNNPTGPFNNINLTINQGYSASTTSPAFFDSHAGNTSISNRGSLTATSGYDSVFSFSNLGSTSSLPTMTITNYAGASMKTTGDDSITIYNVASSNKAFNFSLTNAGTINASGNNSFAVASVQGSPNGINTVDNSGVIRATNASSEIALLLQNGSSSVSNSGTISIGDASQYAIYFLKNAPSLNNATILNIQNGSNIIGRIKANCTNNTVNYIKSTASATDINDLFAQLDGTWTVNASTTSISVDIGDTIANAIGIKNGATLSNLGTMSDIAVSGNSNTLTLGANSVTGNLTVSGTLTVQADDNFVIGNIANTGTITINTSLTNLVYGGTISGDGNLVKGGTGLLSLTGVNTNSGNVTVNAGDLKVNGSTNGHIIMNSGTTLSGTGTIGSLILNNGATLAAGNSIGTMNVAGDVTLNSGSTTAIEFNNITMDKTIATGNIVVGGTAHFSLYNYSGNNNFVVSQNILETTGGTRTGTFASTVIDDSNFIVSTDYTNNAVRATISKRQFGITKITPCNKKQL